MKLNLNIQSSSELFRSQKYLIKAISVFSAIIIFVAGTVLDLVLPEVSQGTWLRACSMAVFLFSAFIASRNTTSMVKAELTLALAGATLLSKTLAQYYISNFSSFQIISSAMIIIGLSGVFISRLSLIILSIPTVSFIIFSVFSPQLNPIQPPESAFVFLLCATVIGYFLTWQKVYLINKSLEQEIHKNTVINNLQEGTLLQSVDGKTLSFNKAARQILGLTNKQLLGIDATDAQWNLFNSDGVTPCLISELPRLIEKSTHAAFKDRHMVLKQPGNRVSYLEFTATPILSNQQNSQLESILITFRDVTDIRKAQETIENQNLEMLAHSKLTSLGEMAAGIAHEINNPLTIILGRAFQTQKLIETDKASKEDILRNLSKISETTLRISNIVKSMKALSYNDQSVEFQSSKLRHIVDDIINVSADHFQKNNVKISVNIDPSIEIDCHPGLLGQLFINLMNNSVDAIKTTATDRWIQINAVTNKKTITIAFKDSGPGIPPALRDKVMLPFFTTKGVGKGTGIGLSLCRTIVENHKGKFYIDEASPTTCFLVELPIEQVRESLPSAA